MLKVSVSLGNECCAECGRGDDDLWIEQNFDYVFGEWTTVSEQKGSNSLRGSEMEMIMVEDKVALGEKGQRVFYVVEFNGSREVTSSENMKEEGWRSKIV